MRKDLRRDYWPYSPKSAEIRGSFAQTDLDKASTMVYPPPERCDYAASCIALGFDLAREPLADAFFGFPDVVEADLDFVADTLSFLDFPAFVVDSRLKVVTSNLQGRDTLAWIRSTGPALADGAEDDLPPALADVIGPRLRKRVHRVVKDVTVIADPPFLFDIFVSKGRVLGETYTFVVLMTASTGQRPRRGPALERLLEGFSGGAMVADRDVNFVYINQTFLDLAGYAREELIGRHLTEFNTSEQARAYGRVFKNMIAEPQILRSPAATYSTVRRGTFVVPLTAWTITDRHGEALGLAVVGGFRSRPRPEAARVERRHVLLEKAADLMSEAIFITDLDGDILVRNPAAENLIVGGADKETLNIKTDVPWEIPETIEDVFTGLAGGREQFLFNTAVVLPSRKAVLKVRVFAIRRVSDVIQEILFVCDDISQGEYLKQTLFQTARRLADDRALRDRVLETIDIPFGVLDRDLTILYINRAAVQRFGLSGAELEGAKLTDINPNLKKTGFVDSVRQAFETKQIVRQPDYAHIARRGSRSSIKLSLIPVELSGRTVCAAVAETEAVTDAGGRSAGLSLRTDIADAVLRWVPEGVLLIARDGTFLEVSDGLVKGSSLPRERFVGRNVKDVLAELDKGGLYAALWERVLTAEEPFQTGVVRSWTRADGSDQFVDIVINPLKGPDGVVEKYLVIVHYLREIKDLEHEIKDYTVNLERMVAEKTRELSASNALLAGTAERVGRIARSGEMMMSLKDRDTVIDSFLRQTGDVLRADFLRLMLRDTSSPPKLEHHTRGAEPEKSEAAREVIEEATARMMLDPAFQKKVWAPLDNLLLAEFVSGKQRAVLVCMRDNGRFTSIEVDLAHLLCTQLSFALPAAAYVAGQRRDREKAECLRRIAFRVAGIASVKEAMRAVAEELSGVICVDRFFWLVNETGGRVWVTEVFRRDGVPAGRSVHVDMEPGIEGIEDLFGGGGVQEISCERLRGAGNVDGRSAAGTMSAECPFIVKGDDRDLTRTMRRKLENRGLIDDDEGSCTIVPVQLTHHSRSYLCAHSRSVERFPNDDICFMCLAAAAVGHVWLEADSASSIRRLETAGETVSELAHDFRLPMAKITDLLRRLASGKLRLADGMESAGSLLKDVEGLSAVSREFIDLSRPGSDRPEFIDLIWVLESSLTLAADDLERKSVTVKREFGDDQPLPPVFVSRNDLMRILINLIANSHDAVDEGGWIKLEAFVDRESADKPRVTLTLRHSGPPVPQEVRDCLFSPFKSGREGGTGLGLFSAKRRANANGGDVTFEIDHDGTERFKVWFPAAFE